MKPFSKNEVFAVLGILFFIFVLTFLNMQVSLRKARDSQRRADLGEIANALRRYQNDFGFYPPSKDGKILACKGSDFDSGWNEIKNDKEFDQEKFFNLLVPCEWGKDPLKDVTDEAYPPYLKVIPGDPKGNKGISYLYLSNTKRFQIYAYLEGKEKEIGYDKSVVARSLFCGQGYVCSFGKSYGVPLDISIEEYERELLEQSKSK